MKGLHFLGLAALLMGATSLQAGGTMNKLKKAVTGGNWCCFVDGKVFAEGGKDICVGGGAEAPKADSSNVMHSKFVEMCDKAKGAVKKKE